MFEHYIRYGNQRLRCGYTTGSCAALSAKAAVEWLLYGTLPETVSLRTPRGILIEAPVEDSEKRNHVCCCAVRKDGGDDPDVTDGMLIFSSAEILGEDQGVRIEIEGGAGIGRVTKEGLDQQVGAAAINSVPRQMIEENVREVCEEAGFHGTLRITVYAPEGEERAKKTFNEKLGVVGGISILGTTGIVDPMSERAMIDVIETEVRQAAVVSKRVILIPGNYAEDYLTEQGLSFPEIPVIKFSGYLGEALDAICLEGFEELLLVSHVGKLVKTAGGIMNTHQKTADCRTELFTAHAAICGADTELCRRLMEAPTTDACIELLIEAGLKDSVMESLMKKIEEHLRRRVGKELRFGARMFSKVFGTLGETDGTEQLLSDWRKDI